MPGVSSEPVQQPKWGDVEDTEEIFPPEGVVDANGIKTTVQFHTNEKGQRVKVTRRVRLVKKVVRKNRYAAERRGWRKFGECAGQPPGPESGITALGEEISLVLSLGAVEKPTAKADSNLSVNLGIQCRICGKSGDHWTSRCPYKDTLQEIPGVKKDEAPDAGADSGAPGKYVPPSLRGKASMAGSMDRGRDEATTVRVTNLSEDTKESDLQELFRPFGPVSRIYLAKDKSSNASRGFAFVNFIHKDDAARAIDKLNGFGYDHLILHLEWARPSAPK